jgi:hypothetical protein
LMLDTICGRNASIGVNKIGFESAELLLQTQLHGLHTIPLFSSLSLILWGSRSAPRGQGVSQDCVGC